MAEHEDQHEGGGHGGGHGGGGHAGHGGGPHGGGGHEEGHEGAPEWLISFADNVALMMGFFVILLAMNMAKQTVGGIGGEEEYPSSTPEERMMDFAIAVRAAFNNPVTLDSTDPGDAMLVQRLIQREKAKAERADPGIRGTKDRVESIRPGDYYRVGGTVQFETESSNLSPQARKFIEDTAREYEGTKFVIEVRGHASAAEAHAAGDKGMRLSFERALTVAQRLAGEGIDWSHIRVIACGDNDKLKPVAYNPDDHRPNQRVELIITESVRESDPQPDKPAISSEPAAGPSPAAQAGPAAAEPHH